jgi:hypothetical protein
MTKERLAEIRKFVDTATWLDPEVRELLAELDAVTGERDAAFRECVFRSQCEVRLARELDEARREAQELKDRIAGAIV